MATREGSEVAEYDACSTVSTFDGDDKKKTVTVVQFFARGGDSKPVHRQAEDPKPYLRWSVLSQGSALSTKNIVTGENSHSTSVFSLGNFKQEILFFRRVGATITDLPPTLSVRAPVSGSQKFASLHSC